MPNDLPFSDHGEESSSPSREELARVHQNFISAWRELQQIQAGDMHRAGFQDAISDRLYFPTKMMLVVTEVAEGVEAHRTGDGPDDHLPQYRGFDLECADAVIRLMTIGAERGVNLGELIVSKMMYNRKRPKRHGGKLY